jgi:SAM-dependent methyltransferase
MATVPAGGRKAGEATTGEPADLTAAPNLEGGAMPSMSSVEQALCRSAPWRAFARRVLLPWVLQGVRLRGDVLEIGAGSGAMAAGLLHAAPDLRMIVTDYDGPMVAAAGRLLAPAGERVTVRQADATALPFADDSFDAVLSVLMLHHVVDWERAVAEAARVLRPGGVVVGADLLGTAPARLLHRLEGATYRMVTRRELRATLQDLPFDQVTIMPSRTRLAVRFTARKATAPGPAAGT